MSVPNSYRADIDYDAMIAELKSGRLGGIAFCHRVAEALEHAMAEIETLRAELSLHNGPSSELEKKIAAFAMLPDGWDSYGAPALPRQTINLGMEVAKKLGDEWKAVPCGDGSIEFYRGDEDEIVEVRTCFDSVDATNSLEP